MAVFTLVVPPKILATPAFAAETVVDASCAPWSGVFISCGMATFANLILTIATNVLMMAGTSFDYAVDYSLDMSKRLDDFKFVSNGWGVLRDVTNLAYIFILLYIAINIILGNSGYQDKSLIAKVLVTAVFVNFSLFGAKVIVDATNIAALQFYNLITPASTSSNNANKDSNAKSLTSQFMNLFNLQSIFGNGDKASTNSVLSSVDAAANSSNSSSDKYSQPETWWRIAKLCVLGTVFVIAVTVVFFAGAFLFISRTVVIFFLMLFASLAVASRALPATKSHFDGWLKKLINNAIFAPIFMGLIYIFVSATNKVTGSSQVNLSTLILDGKGISGLVTFFMYLAFLVGLLLIAKQLGIKGGETAHGIADKWLSPKSILDRGKRATIGGVKAGWGATKTLGKGALVRTGGRAATAFAESELVKNTLGRVPILGNALGKVGEKTGWKGVRDAKTKGYEEYDKYISTARPQRPGETDEEYAKVREAAKARGKSAAGFDANGKKKDTFSAKALHFARWIHGGGAWSNFQNDKAKKYKKDAKTKTKLETDLLNHARELGKLLYNNPDEFVDLTTTPPKPKEKEVHDAAGSFNGTLIDPSTGRLVPGLVAPGGQLDTLYIDLETAQQAYDTALRTRPSTDPAVIMAKNTLDKTQATFDKQEKKLKDQFDGFKTKFQLREAMED